MTASAESGSNSRCPWCEAPARADDTRCGKCGAALAQRQSLGEVAIPGVTAVDPALQYADSHPSRLLVPSATEAHAPGVLMGAAMGDPTGIAALGALAALAVTEYRGAGGGAGAKGPANLDEIGRPSEVALRALRRLDEDERNAGDPPPDPVWGDVRRT